MNDAFKRAHTWLITYRADIFLVCAIMLIALAAFGLGRLSVRFEGKEELRIVSAEVAYSVVSEKNSDAVVGEVRGISNVENGAYVASKTGRAYHLPWCAGARTIKPENKVYFATKAEAEAAGYKPAGNCKGI